MSWWPRRERAVSENSQTTLRRARGEARGVLRRSGRAARRGMGEGLEALEPRWAMAARVLVTELVADNTQGIEDEDGSNSDWIELFNAGDAAANLEGWRLTDDPADTTPWTFPAVTLQPDEYLLVFASGKNRRNPASPLHTDFRLAAEGDLVRLSRPDGTVEHQLAYSELLPDRSFGLVQGTSTVTLLPATASFTAFVPTALNGGDKLGRTWIEPAFDDSAWLRGADGVGFDETVDFRDHFRTDIKAQMLGVNGSMFMRVPFAVDNPRAAVRMTLQMKYDDGYVAFLNGVEISRRNTPATIDWNSVAPTTHRDALAVVFEDDDVSDARAALRAGNNVLAIQGINNTINSDDFLMVPQLVVDRPAPLTEQAGRYFQWATPREPNGTVSYSGLAAPVETSVQRGFFEQAFDVTVTGKTLGAALVYTTDGSTPSATNGRLVPARSNESVAKVTLPIAQTTTLRIAAVKEGFLTSLVTTQSYFFLADVVKQDVQATLAAGFAPTWKTVAPDYGLDPDVIGPNDLYNGVFARQILDSLKAAPTVSLVLGQEDLTGPNGIYSNSTRAGDAWEREASFEFIETGGKASVQVNAGLEIQGDNVRNLTNSKKQGLRLSFKERYGASKLKFPVFGAENPDAVSSFDELILRGGYNDSWSHTPDTTQYIRDQWARTTLLAMGQPQVHGRWVHVYLDGFYWGIYNLVERPNAAFSSSYMGGDKDEWDALNTGVVRDGTRDAWALMQSVARDAGSTDPAIANAAYLRLQGKNPDGTPNPQMEKLLDLDNYIDYLIVNFYGGNTDWPGRNYYVARHRGLESEGFKSYAWDTEKILDHGEGSTVTTNQTNVTEGVAAMYRYLRRHEEFRLRFADRVQKHFSPGGQLYVDPASPAWNPQAPEKNAPAARYAELANEFELLLVAESARWGDTQPSGTRPDHRIFTPIEWGKMRDNIFRNYFPKRSAIVLQQFVAGGLYPAAAAPTFSRTSGQVDAMLPLTISGPGTIYYTVDGSDPRRSALDPGSPGTGVAPTASVYSGPVTIQKATVVKARALVDGQWSALTEASFVLRTPPVRVSELMYHPQDPPAGSRYDAEAFEFLELTNISATESVDLTGLQFVDGIGFTFSAGTLAPGKQVVIARDAAAFAERYGNQVPVAGEYGKTPEDYKLSNAGETLKLVDRFGTVIQEFTYRDSWYPRTDGQGYSLNVRNLSADVAQWSEALNWRESSSVNGTPSRPDLVEIPGDFNQDGRLDAADIGVFCAGMKAGDLRFDVTADGRVDQKDLRHVVENYFGTVLGDANLDRRFDSQDLVEVFQAGRYEDGRAGNASWAQGDWNCDGEFDSHDFVEAFTAGGYIDTPGAARAIADVAAALAGRAERRESGDE